MRVTMKIIARIGEAVMVQPPRSTPRSSYRIVMSPRQMPVSWYKKRLSLSMYYKSFYFHWVILSFTLTTATTVGESNLSWESPSLEIIAE